MLVANLPPLRQTGQPSHDVVPGGKSTSGPASLCLRAAVPGGEDEDEDEDEEEEEEEEEEEGKGEGKDEGVRQRLHKSTITINYLTYESLSPFSPLCGAHGGHRRQRRLNSLYRVPRVTF
ncbi:hypothetical protein SprV_0702330200 [Sparganum proliferum]